MAFVHNGSVATCFMESVLAAFAEDTTRAARGHRRRLVEYHEQRGPYITTNRCLCADYFLERSRCQWLWFLDNDIEFPADSLYRLLGEAEGRGLGILGAAYWNEYANASEDRSGRFLSWLLFTEEGIQAIDELPPQDEPVEVSAVGMGCTLIHRDVVQAVADMHAEHPWSTFGADLIRYDDGSQQVMGEDVTFCTRARRAGFATYGLPTLTVEHFKAGYVEHGSRPAIRNGREVASGNGANRTPAAPMQLTNREGG